MLLLLCVWSRCNFKLATSTERAPNVSAYESEGYMNILHDCNRNGKKFGVCGRCFFSPASYFVFSVYSHSLSLGALLFWFKFTLLVFIRLWKYSIKFCTFEYDILRFRYFRRLCMPPTCFWWKREKRTLYAYSCSSHFHAYEYKFGRFRVRGRERGREGEYWKNEPFFRLDPSHRINLYAIKFCFRWFCFILYAKVLVLLSLFLYFESISWRLLPVHRTML